MVGTMKQLELNRLLNAILKKEAKSRGWKSIGGQPYWREGDLFFTLLVVPVARQRSLHSSLRIKWFSLDEHLWRVLGMSSNASAPMSLHANGAFTLSGQEVLADTVQDCEWSAQWVEASVRAIASAAADKSAQVSSTTANIDDYLALIEREHTALMARYPKAVVNLWTERLLVALEKNYRRRAADIARERVAARDPGTFVAGGRTFYQRALEYVERDA